MNKEEQVNHWYYKDLGWLGAYIVETNGECTKQVDVSHIKKYIEELLQENKQIKSNRDEAIELGNKQLLSNSNYTGFTDEMCLKEMLEILERGKE